MWVINPFEHKLLRLRGWVRPISIRIKTPFDPCPYRAGPLISEYELPETAVTV